MTKTVTRLFDTFADAEAAVEKLRAFGLPYDEISLVAAAPDGAPAAAGLRDAEAEATVQESGHDAAAGASIGGIIGGVGGIAAGLGLLAIPGLGPVLAAGWLVTTVVGAVTGAATGGVVGGLIGALMHAGVPEHEAHVYAEGVRRGGALVSARVEDDQSDEVEAILGSTNAVDLTERADTLRAEGWTAFDAASPISGRDFDPARADLR